MSNNDFFNYLESNPNVSNNRIPRYLRWVNLFIRFSKKQPGLFLPDKLIDPFLTEFGQGHEQWKVEQAREAINLYCHFLKMVSGRQVKGQKPLV